jgi:hypothetical protein
MAKLGEAWAGVACRLPRSGYRTQPRVLTLGHGSKRMRPESGARRYTMCELPSSQRQPVEIAKTLAPPSGRIFADHRTQG